MFYFVNNSILSARVLRSVLSSLGGSKHRGICDSSSVGRVQPSHGWGREFEPRLSHKQRPKL